MGMPTRLLNGMLGWFVCAGRSIEVGAGSSLTLSPLKISERVLHYLVGIQHTRSACWVSSSLRPQAAIPSRPIRRSSIT